MTKKNKKTDYYILEGMLSTAKDDLENILSSNIGYFVFKGEYFVSDDFSKSLDTEKLTGYEITEPQLPELQANYRQLQITGKAKKDDMGISRKGSLIISKNAKKAFEKNNITNIKTIPIFQDFKMQHHVYDVELAEIIDRVRQKLGSEHELLRTISDIIDASAEIPQEYKRQNETNAKRFVVVPQMYAYSFFLAVKLLFVKTYRVSFILNYHFEISEQEDNNSFLKLIEFSVLSTIENLMNIYSLNAEVISVVSDWLLNQSASVQKNYYTLYTSDDEKEKVLLDLFCFFSKLESFEKRLLEANNSQVELIVKAIQKNISGDLQLERLIKPKQKIKWNLTQKDVAFVFFLIKNAEYQGEKPWADIKIEVIMSKLFILNKDQVVNEKSVLDNISKFKSLTEPDFPKKSDDLREAVFRFLTLS